MVEILDDGFLDDDFMDDEDEDSFLIAGLHLQGMVVSLSFIINSFKVDCKYLPNLLLFSVPQQGPDRVLSKSFPDNSFYGGSKVPVGGSRSFPKMSGSLQV